MCKKLMLLSCLVTMLGLSNIAFADFLLFKVDMSCPGKPLTVKGDPWIDFEIGGGCTGGNDDQRTKENVNGTGIDVTIGDPGGTIVFISRTPGDAICNSAWVEPGCENVNFQLIFENLDPSTSYTVHTYHAWEVAFELEVERFKFVDTNTVITTPQVVDTTSDATLLESAGVGVIQFTTTPEANDVTITFDGCVRFNAFALYSAVAKPMATSPYPPSGKVTGFAETAICPNGLQLSWTPVHPNLIGPDDLTHDVYFGTDYNDVNDANRGIHPGIVYYSQGQDSNKYPVDGNLSQLELGTTYYWRIDSVNDPCIYRGQIWEFTTEDGNAYKPFPYDPYRYDWDIFHSEHYFRGFNPADTNLMWTNSCVAAEHKLWFATDLPGSIVLFKDDFESGAFEPNWTNSGWDIWDANDDPCWQHFRPRDHNLARATSGGGKTLTSTDIDASDDCNAIRVSFYFRSTKGRWLAADELQIKYYDGSTYNAVNDFNVATKRYDPNGRWVHFEDRITDSNYLISNFRIQLYADLSDSNVWVDEFTISNSWPVNPIWREATLSADTNSYAPTLSPFTHYYWRVDTVVGNKLVQGEFWEFRTGLGGLLLEMLFEGTLGNDLPATVPDSSSNNLEFTTFASMYDPCATGSVKYAGPPFDVSWEPTSADFDPNAGLYRKDPCGPNDTDLLRLDGYKYTIEFWVRPDRLDPNMEVPDWMDDDWLDDDWDLMLISKYADEEKGRWSISIQDPGGTDEYVWTHEGQNEGIGDYFAEVGEWAHITAVYDWEDEPNRMKLYYNGELTDTDDAQLVPPDSNYPVTIGYAYKDDVNMGRYFEGCIDNLRIWDLALELELEMATNPYPPDKSRGWEPTDANLAKFMWRPGKHVQNTGGHKIYFGESWDDVNESADPCATLDNNEWPNTLTFEIGKNYYWRVDEVNGTDEWTGKIWWFQMRTELIDPCIVVRYQLNELSGQDVWDSSGRLFDAECDSPAHWEPNNGRFDGCMHFSMEQEWDVDDEEWEWTNEQPGVIRTKGDVYGREMAQLLNNGEISISVWVNGDPNQRRDKDQVIFELCDTGYEEDYYGDPDLTKILAVFPTEPTDTGFVVFRAGVYPEDTLIWNDLKSKAARGSWQHFVFIKDESEAKMYIYHNAELVAHKEDCNTVSLYKVLGTGDVDLQLGAYLDNDNGYHGRLDDFHIYRKHLDQAEIDGLFRGGRVELAWSPSPADGLGNVAHTTDLTWNAGNYTDETDGHEVFFGTNYDEVFDANSTNPADHPNVIHDTCSTPFFDPPIDLNLGQTYYWRVDEVNLVPDACEYTGNIWSFTVSEFYIIDDFEDYIDTSDVMTNGWIKGGGPYFVRGLVDESVEWFLQPLGWKSLYTKSSTWKLNPPGGASWMTSNFELDPNDWADPNEEMRIFSLWFYGDRRWVSVGGDDMWSNPCTETERWWVELEDIYGQKAKVWYPSADGNDFDANEWMSWEIPLKYFKDDNASLDLRKMLKIHIGTGSGTVMGVKNRTIVYFDDIMLKPGYCDPSKIKPVADFTGPYNECDCLVDYYDLNYMSDRWLDSDCNCVEEYGSMSAPPDQNLVAWYKFDDGDGNQATDSSGNAYHGTISVNDVNVFWVTPGANDAGYALEFAGGWVSIPNEVYPKLERPNSVTVCAWINRLPYIYHYQGMHIVCKGRHGKESYNLEINDDGVVSFNIGGKDLKSDDPVAAGEWIHVAGACDGNNMILYLNGRIEANDVKGKFEFGTDPNDGLGIGERYGDLGNITEFYPFIGTIDDVRIYDCNLSRAEICYIASDGDGVAELASQANIFTAEPEGTPQAVNLKDFALLMFEWLAEEQPLLWPPEE